MVGNMLIISINQTTGSIARIADSSVLVEKDDIKTKQVSNKKELQPEIYAMFLCFHR